MKDPETEPKAIRYNPPPRHTATGLVDHPPDGSRRYAKKSKGWGIWFVVIPIILAIILWILTHK